MTVSLLGVDVRYLDSRTVAPSRWHTREPSRFASDAFIALKDSIAHSTGNLVPIAVRPLDTEGTQELVYGLHRLQACRELGLPVLAIVHPTMTVYEAAAVMLAEAKGGTPYAPYELGLALSSMLDAGLFPSTRKMSDALGVPEESATAAMRLAKLPRAVLEAFTSPNDVQTVWATKLQAAYDRDPAGMPAEIHRLRERERGGVRALSPRAIYQGLTADLSA